MVTASEQYFNNPFGLFGHDRIVDGSRVTHLFSIVFCLSSFCIPNVVCVSRLFILKCPFDFLSLSCIDNTNDGNMIDIWIAVLIVTIENRMMIDSENIASKESTSTTHSKLMTLRNCYNVKKIFFMSNYLDICKYVALIYIPFLSCGRMGEFIPSLRTPFCKSCTSQRRNFI